MHTVTFYPLGNADTSKIDLANGRTLLFDYANTRDPDDENDLRIDLPKQLRAELSKARRKSFDVVAFTHLDDDHVTGLPTSSFWNTHLNTREMVASRSRIFGCRRLPSSKPA